MNIIELINYCGGVDAVSVQAIQGSAIKVVDKKRTSDCEVTIATNEMNANSYMNNSGKVGLIVWVDGDKARRAIG